MNFISGIILFLVGVFSGASLIWVLRQKEIDLLKSNQDERKSNQDQLKSDFGDLSKQALDQNIETFLNLAKDKFSELAKNSDVQLDQKKELIDHSIIDMKKKLEGLTESTTKLKVRMEESKKGIDDLADTTSKLSKILDSSQTRGHWGERMVKDILNHLGMKKGINFNTQSGSKKGRPDFTFLLPHKKRLNMDVKFPWDHYANLFSANAQSEKDIERKSFLKDVKGHINALSKRDYIDPADGTLDFVLMFIPNEGIYAFLNKPKTGEENLVEFAMGNKVLLCSPVTLFAILAMVRQSVQSFELQSEAGEFYDLLQAFKKEWVKFSVKMEAMGKSIGTVNTHYKDLSEARRKKLQVIMDRIYKLELGQGESSEKLSE